MAESKQTRDPIPAQFQSIEAAAEFWDTHDLDDYWDLTQEAEFELDLQQQAVLTALEPRLATKLADYARKQGISTETLINLWLSEKMAAVIAGESQN